MRWRNRKKRNPLETEKEGKTNREICNSGNYQYAGELVI